MLITEPFVFNDHIEKSSDGLKIQIYEPNKVSTVYKYHLPWDNNNWTTYFNLLQPDPSNPKLVHMYYRANFIKPTHTDYHAEYTCVLISKDGGYTFSDPKLSLFPTKKSARVNSNKKNKKVDKKTDKNADKKSDGNKNINEVVVPDTTTTTTVVNPNDCNNIVWNGVKGSSHNFYAFKKPNEKIINAIGGACASSCGCCCKGIFFFESYDGLKWIEKEKILTSKNSSKQAFGTFFDSLNCMFWDPFRNEYKCFLRYNSARGCRQIQYAASNDLLHWPVAQPLKFGSGSSTGDCYYNTNFMMYPNSPYFVGFPSRQVKDNKLGQAITFMFSRDALNWNVIKHKWLGSHCKSPERYVTTILESANKAEYLLYVNNPLDMQVNLYSIRKDGFGSISTMDDTEQWFISSPIVIMQPDFYLNYKILTKTGHLKLSFIEVSNVSDKASSKDSSKDLSKDSSNHPNGLVLHTCNNLPNADLINHSIGPLPANCLNKCVQIKFTMKECSLYCYRYHGEAAHNTHIYSNSVQVASLGEKNKNKDKDKDKDNIIQKKLSSKSAQKQKDEKTAVQKHKSSEEQKAFDDKKQNIKSFNEFLKQHTHITSISYEYHDLLNPQVPVKISNVPCMGDNLQVIDLVYSNNNRAGGGEGMAFYGRIATLKLSNGKSIILCKNSKANCRIKLLCQ